MIYASDLDQTLIYSRSTFMLNGTYDPDIRLIELLNGEEISFMTEKAIKLLRDIADNLMFVPVTTRTIEQYTRISVFQEEVKPKYAITSNGGNILYLGKIDQMWRDKVLERIDHECMAEQEMLAEFNRLANDSWVLRGKKADDLFYYFIVDLDRVPSDELEEFGKWLDRQGWNLSLQGRKLYLVPKVCNKKDAVQYVMEKEGEGRLIASGDSLLDLCFLSAAQYAIAPAHGELFERTESEQDMEHIRFTASAGIASSEEILEMVATILKGV